MTVSESILGLGARARRRSRAVWRGQSPAYTLIELVVVSASLALIIPLASFFLFNVINRTDDTQARTTVLAQEQLVVDRIAREVRQGSALTIAGGGDTIDIVTPQGRFFWDCSGTTCTRAVFSGGSFGSPVTELEGISPSGPVFTSATLTGSAGTTVRILVTIQPEERDRPIEIQREVHLRNV